jgi:hypothetical protein
MLDGERTLQRIVAEAATLFNQRGFQSGSMAELMRQLASKSHLESYLESEVCCFSAEKN